MYKFRPSNLTQNHIKFTELQLIGLIEKGLSDNSLRGYLYKRSSPNGKWRLKWFLLFENLLFYFDVNPNDVQAQSKQDQPNHHQAAAAAAAKISGERQQDKQQASATQTEIASSITSSPNNIGGSCSGSFKSPRRTLSSLIKRGSTKQQQQQQPALSHQQQQHQQQQQQQPHQNQNQAKPFAATNQASNDWQQLEFPVEDVAAKEASSSSALSGGNQFRRASTSGLLADQKQLHQVDGAANLQTAHLATNNSALLSQNAARGRISSDPLTGEALSNTCGPVSQRLHYQPHGCSHTTNSSTVSGVSGHFSGHNELTIGRLTTTTAGKTASASSNYASLLSRRKGVIFLEGSYCERVADFPNSVCLPTSASSLLSPSKRTRHSIGAGGSKSLTKKSSSNQNRPSAAPEEQLTGDQLIRSSSGKSPVHTSKRNYHHLQHHHHQVDSEFNCIFTLRWKKEGSKEYQFRSATEAECFFWVHAISNARYSSLLNDKEQLEQKYLHLSQIIESESTAKWQYFRQCEEFSGEINKLRQEICSLKRQELQTNDLRLALAKSAAFCDKLMWKHRLKVEQKQQQQAQMQRLTSVEHSPDSHSDESSSSKLDHGSRVGGASPLDRVRTSDEAAPLSDMGERPNKPDDKDQEHEEENLTQELKSVVEAINNGLVNARECFLGAENCEELRKIKKVQAFFRGWLCRRRWKLLVEEYIKSPQAESMRKRNNLVFHMVECEEEYVEQLALLISGFLRPIKMAASSQKPALSHDELNSIFLNSETLLFLHQIFLKGLTARMESWPTLVLGDLFNMLLPMLQIYQEFVRNHHFSLQVLAECKQRDQFSQILRRLEDKPHLNGRTLETFLTYPMYQIPRYITCLHDILAHTPHNHVERRSLYEAQTRLEELSQQMQDEVSETENIRQNLAIERMIVGGCDILLDVNQVFVRQGSLMQVIEEPCGKENKSVWHKLTPFGSNNNSNQQTDSPLHQNNHQFAQTFNQLTNGSNADFCDSTILAVNSNSTIIGLNRQCFLFSNYLVLCTRDGEGKLHLAEGIGRISLSEMTLVENPIEFVHQQETIIANFNESIQEQRRQEEQLRQQQQSNCNQGQITAGSSTADCGSRQTGFAADGSTDSKRHSTVSASSKSNSNGKKRVSHVEFELDPKHQTGALQNGSKRAGSVFLSGGQVDEWIVSSGSNRRKASSVSSRGWFPGYLATKLSNLTNLGSSNHNHLDANGTLSAPPSPLTKRSQPSWRLPSTFKSNTSSNQHQSYSVHSSQQQLHNEKYQQYLQNLYNLSKEYAGCDFILLLESNSSLSASSSTIHKSSSAAYGSGSMAGNPLAIHLVAQNLQEKAAWITDISQCIDNVHFNDLFHGLLHDNTSLTMSQSIRNDPKLFKDDIDIKFSRALNSCKLPHIRYASNERLYLYLTDLRFLSIDFLNTFLLTYRVYTNAEEILEVLKNLHYNWEGHYQRYLSQEESEANNANPYQEARCLFGEPNNHGANASSSSNARASTSNQTVQSQTETTPKPQTPAGELHKPIVGQQAASCSNKVTAAGTQQKPFVPPRLQHAPHQSQQSAEAGANMGTKYLLAPGAAQQHSKRRSTISALTPITGSTSSSLVNLAAASAPNQAQQAQQPPPLPQQEPRTSTSGNDSANSSVFQIGDLGGSNSNIENELMASIHLSDGYLVDQDLAQIFDQQQTLDRVRSSSMSNPGQLAPDQAVMCARPFATGSSRNLNVPGCRQVRASSVSHVPGLVARSLQTSGGTEHWRLSYKKSTANLNNNTQNPNESKSFLTATRYLANSTAANRRASSSDVDVTFHVTVHISPDTQQQGQQPSADKRNCDSDELLNLPTPQVPPSSPAEPATGTARDFDLAQSSTGESPIKHSPADGKTSPLTTRRRCKTEPSRVAAKPSRVIAARPQIASSSTTSSITSEAASGVKSTSDSESILIQSSSSSSSLLSSPREPAQTNKLRQTRLGNGHPQQVTKSHRQRRQLSRSESGKAKLASYKQPSLANGRQISLIIKEIDLTDTKTLDCDTSADEEKVVTTSSEDELSGSEDENAQSRLNQDERDSVKLLTRLNSNKKKREKIKKVEVEAQDSKLPAREPEKGKSQTDKKQEEQKCEDQASVKAEKPQTQPQQVKPEQIKQPTAQQQQQQHQHRPRQSITKTPEDPKHLTASNRPSLTTTTPNSSRLTTPRSSFAHHTTEASAISKAGVIISSSSPRVSSRRSSTASAASAFAAATAASMNPILTQPQPQPNGTCECIYQQQQIAANLRRCSTTFSPSAGPYRQLNMRYEQQLLARGLHPQQQQLHQVVLHSPNCVHFNQQQHLLAAYNPSHSFPNMQSDASSPMNSRASSRLSSCAGLDYNSYNTVNANQNAATISPIHGDARTPSRQAPGGANNMCASLLSNIIKTNVRQVGIQRNLNLSPMVIRSLATIRVLSVLRHWVSKHPRDFVENENLSRLTQEFLQDLMMDSSLLSAEHKAAVQLIQMVQNAAQTLQDNTIDFDLLLAPPLRPSRDSIETLSALDIAEGMTYLDHKIFLAIRSEEFLDNAWQKKDKAIRAPHILLITKRFNDASCLVSSEILRAPELTRRVAIIEKWTNVAHICRVVHNFNGVLQICAAFSHSSVLRLKKTWDKVPKTTKTTVDGLQNLVCTGSKFKNMRDALARCDPPSVPYVGMYLAQLNMYEEGTPNYNSAGLLNFSKMRMIAHTIREIKHLQNGNYKIEIKHRVANYLLDESRLLSENQMETLSHAIEPRQANGKSHKNGFLGSSASSSQSANGGAHNSK